MMTTAPTHEDAKEAARKLTAFLVDEGYRPSGLYSYEDAEGQPLFWRVRLDHPTEGKWIRPLSFNGNGWELKEPVFQDGKPLYRLPDIARNPTATVWLVEGEKCADALAKLGLVAATSGASTSANAADWRPLAGRNAILWPDNDEPGKRYMAEVSAKLLPLGCRVQVVDIARLNLLEGGDCVDWLATRNGAKAADVEGLPLVETQIELSDWPEQNVPAQWPSPPPEEAFHGLAGGIVRAIEPHTEADRVALLIQLLVTFGDVIGRTAHFHAGGKHFLNLFAVLIGATSKGRKGTSWSCVSRLFNSIDEPWARGCVHSGLSSGEGLIWAVRDPIEKTEPIRDKRKEVTGYQSVIVDPGIEDKRALIIEGEFASPLKVMRREGNTLSSIIRNAWDGLDLRAMTKNSPARATEPHISIIGHITADELRRHLDETEAGNGFANRFLWTCVRRAKCLPEGGSLHLENLSPVVERLREAVVFARTVGEMRRDEQARTMWHEVYPELSEGQPGLLGSVIARAEAQALRLSCLYALLDLSKIVRVEHLEAGLAIWEYCEASARFVFGDSMGDPVADEIKRALDANPSGMTRTEVSSLFGRNASTHRLGLAFESLLSAGLIRSSMERGEGRPTERFFSMRHGTN
ncbi:MAG: DUF3987 domain-containing protein [Nitrospinae bacterium]|nr:DUF3987 domain-containing protein [Nitrospinota bacterium]